MKWHGQVVADLPVASLAADAPLYDRPSAAPKTASDPEPSPSESLRDSDRLSREITGEVSKDRGDG